MIKGSKVIRQRLRRAVRREVAASPALRRERRRLRQSSGNIRVPGFFRFLCTFSIVLIFNALGNVDSGRIIVFIVPLLAYWALLVTVYRALQIHQVLSNPSQLSVPYVLPVENAVAFDSQQRILHGSACWLWWDFTVFGLIATWHFGGDALTFIAILLFAVAQGILSLSLAWMIVSWCPRRLLQTFSSILFGLGAALFIAIVYHAPAFERLALELLSYLVAITPAGWLLWGWEQVLLHGSAVGWLTLALAPTAGLIAFRLQRERRACFRMETIFGYDEKDMENPADDETSVGDITATEVAAAASTEVEPSRVQRSLALVEPVTAALRNKLAEIPADKICSEGSGERMLARWLTPRQRVLLEVMQPKPIQWQRLWLLALGLIVIARFVLNWLPLSPDSIEGLRIIIFLAAGVFLLPAFFENWLGFQRRRVFQSLMPNYAFYPVGIMELAWLYWKIGAARSVAFFPFILLAVRLATPLKDFSWATVLVWSAQASYVLALAQAGALLHKITHSTNDTSRLTWFACVLVGGFIFSGIAFTGMAIAFFMVSTVGGALALAALLALLCLGSVAAYGFFYNGNFFDLVTLPQK